MRFGPGLVAAAVAFLASCATVPMAPVTPIPPKPLVSPLPRAVPEVVPIAVELPTPVWHETTPVSPVLAKVLATGLSLIGNKPSARVKVNGRSFTLDCVGTVSAAWWGAGIDLQADFAKYSGDAVNRLYESLSAWGALHWRKIPAPGDLIIWDHTWNTGNDPLFASGHTHAGMVVSVSSEGTVAYLHESVTRGIVIAYLNLNDPAATLTKAGLVINSPMFLGSNYGKKDNPPLWTSGQLWSAFGNGALVVRARQEG